MGKVFNNKFKNHQVVNAFRSFKNFPYFKNKVFFNSLLENTIVKEIKKSDVIINFAGESISIDKMFSANVLFVKKLVNQINRYNKKCIFIHLSTCGIYQDIAKSTLSINEKTNPSPVQKYARTKYLGEQYVLRRCKSRKLVLRPAQILGKGMSNQSLYKLIYYLKRNYFFYINDKKAVWSFTDINDIIEIFKLIINKKRNIEGSLNVASTIEMSNLITIIKKKFNINSLQPTINLKLLRLVLKPLDLMKIKHPLRDNVIKSLTMKKIYSKKKISKFIKLSEFQNVKY